MVAKERSERVVDPSSNVADPGVRLVQNLAIDLQRSVMITHGLEDAAAQEGKLAAIRKILVVSLHLPQIPQRALRIHVESLDPDAVVPSGVVELT